MTISAPFIDRLGCGRATTTNNALFERAVVV